MTETKQEPPSKELLQLERERDPMSFSSLPSLDPEVLLKIDKGSNSSLKKPIESSWLGLRRRDNRSST
jgi:hypothetical protein